MLVSREILEELYINKHYSVTKITSELGISRHNVSACMSQYGMAIRTKSETTYLQHNKSFRIKSPLSEEEAVLYGLGIGLYWGEGNKADKYSVRLGNTDPHLIKQFVSFLRMICGIDYSEIKFGLQVFNDADPIQAEKFWLDTLECSRDKLHKTISVIKPRGSGSYKRKNKYGVIQVYVCNKRFKDWMMAEIEKYAEVAQW